MSTRVAALLAQMTTAEKIGQLNLLSAGEGPETGSAHSRNIAARLEKGELGALFGTKSVASVRAWQELALAGSRHAIPLFFAEDVIHGHRTIFPLPIALACAFDPLLWHDVARVAATEAAADGINQVYAPMIDVARDPRWGRIAESPGEDPFLAARYAEAMVRGFQGDGPGPDTAVACLKHFLAYGAAVGGRDYDNVSLGPEEIVGVYAEPFRAGVAAGAGSVMASFNALNKRPMHAHRELLRGFLRGRLRFDGLIVSDYTGVMELAAHGLGDRATCAALALLAGIDMDMVGEDFLAHLPRLAADGLSRPESGVDIPAVDIRAAIDEACGRVLRFKDELGLFDDPFRFCDAERSARTALAPAHRALARRAIADSCVLLKNEGAVLPLAPGARVALVGAMADDRTNLLGTWAVSGDFRQAVTLLEGLTASHEGLVACVKGADIVDDPVLAERLNVHGQTVFLDARDAAGMIAEAVEAARAADVVVAVVGEAKEYSGECSSVTDLALPRPQRALLEALAQTGTKLVLVVTTGRPLALEREMALADAVLLVWFAGTEAGNGIADVLTGRAEPSGRLSAAFPARTGQVPVHHQAEPTGRPYVGRFQKFRTGYLDLPDTVAPATGLIPFGFGLSYTRFEWEAPTVDRDHLTGPDDRAVVRVALTNVGDRRGSEVVQLYVSDPVARIVRPLHELKGFEKVTLDPGERREIVFTLDQAALSYPMGETVMSVAPTWDPGTFVLSVGPNSRDLQSVAIVWEG